jgi:predicted RNA-binding protein with PIN domain
MTLVLVDGSNVAQCAAWAARNGGIDQHTLRRRLVDSLGSWAAGGGYEVFATFDGAGPWRPGSVRISSAVEVFGTGDVEGDDVLARQAVAAVRSGNAYWLVTSDRGLQLLAGGGADRTISADAFVAELAAPSIDAASVTTELPAGTRLAESLDPATRARLERMRRGDLD